MEPAQFATAYALSTSVGLRPFLTLALASLAMHFGYLHPSHAFAALGSDGATVLLAVLAVLEFFAEKVPAVDHALHAVHFATKPIAAAVLIGATDAALVPPGDPAFGYALMGAAAVNALGVHAGVAALRGASTVTTAGIANPFVSLIEDALTVVGTVLAILLPVAGATLAFLLTLALFFLARAVVRQLRARAPAAKHLAG
jgi:hypothetical protein